MNILVIGNGFDLAHELPTKYTDFLDFCKIIRSIYTAEMYADIYRCWDYLSFKERENTKKIENLFTELFERRQVDKETASDYVKEQMAFCDCYDEFYKCIRDNLWIEYFEQNPMYQKENWIDFELEIRKVIESLDEDMCYGEGKKYELEDMMCHLSDTFLSTKYGEYPNSALVCAVEQE